MRMGGSRLAAPALAIVAGVLLLGANAPGSPGAARISDLAATPGSAAGGGAMDGILGLLLLGALGLALVIAVAAAAVILYRTRASRAPRTPEEGWWTCQSCGAGNIDGASRCHACATWRASVPHPNPTTTA
jgi:hypothetical protein